MNVSLSSRILSIIIATSVQAISRLPPGEKFSSVVISVMSRQKEGKKCVNV